MIKSINSAIINIFGLPTYNKDNPENKEKLLANITSIFNKFLSIFFGNKPGAKKANLESDIKIEGQKKEDQKKEEVEVQNFSEVENIENKKESLDDMPRVNIFEVYGKKENPLPNDPLPLDKEFIEVSTNPTEPPRSKLPEHFTITSW